MRAIETSMAAVHPSCTKVIQTSVKAENRRQHGAQIESTETHQEAVTARVDDFVKTQMGKES